MELTISRTGDGEHFARDHRDVTIRLDLPQLSVHEIEFDHAFEVPQHRHDHVDALYVLAGTVELLSGGRSVRVGPDTLVAAPAGAPHGFRIVQVHPDAKSMDFHLQVAGDKIHAAFAVVDNDSVDVYGTPAQGDPRAARTDRPGGRPRQRQLQPAGSFARLAAA